MDNKNSEEQKKEFEKFLAMEKMYQKTRIAMMKQLYGRRMHWSRI